LLRRPAGRVRRGCPPCSPSPASPGVQRRSSLVPRFRNYWLRRSPARRCDLAVARHPPPGRHRGDHHLNFYGSRDNLANTVDHPVKILLTKC
jgi:hypothetical protein